MTKTQRVLTALNGQTPDCVPYIHNCIAHDLQEKILGRQITGAPTVDNFNVTGWLGPVGGRAQVAPSLTVLPETAALLNLDAIGIQILPPMFVDAVDTQNGRYIARGQLTSAQALSRVTMPDPDDPALYRETERIIARYKGDFAMYARVRLGAACVLQSMSIEDFAYCLIDEPETVAQIIEMYTEWSRRVSQNLSELGFDFFWCFDDIAFSTGMLISPETFRSCFKEPLHRAASGIKKPFIFHSDGAIQHVLNDIIDIGARGLHPIEPGSMDGDWLKQNYGDKLCLIGNIDIDEFLTRGTPQTVNAEVRRRIAQFGPGGGYIISDSNSVPSCCRAENVLALGQAVEEWRWIY